MDELRLHADSPSHPALVGALLDGGCVIETGARASPPTRIPPTEPPELTQPTEE
jgi:hypothetical protein